MPSGNGNSGDIALGSELRASETLFRLLVEQVSDYAIFMLDVTGRMATWNAGAQRLKGYQATEIIGQRLTRFYRPEDRWKCEQLLEAATRNGRAEDEGWRVRKDGSVFWASVVITAVHDAQGKLLGFAKVTRDLTDRKRAEEERIELAEQAAAREAAQGVADLLARLNSVVGSMAAAKRPEEVARVMVEEGARSLRAAQAAFFQPNEGRLKMIAKHGLPAAAVDAWGDFSPEHTTPVAVAFRTRVPQWVENTAEYSAHHGGAEFISDSPSASLPLAIGERTLGVVGFWFDGPRSFTFDECALMQTMAVQAAQALDRAQSYDREVEARHRVEALKELSEALSRALSTEEVTQVVLNTGMRAVHADTCTLYTMDEESRSFELVGERGCGPAVINRVRRLAADAMDPDMNRPHWVESFAEYQSLFPSLANGTGSTSSDGPRARAFWSLPLIAEGRSVGLLGMGFYQERRFTPDERNFVETLGGQCAEAILRASNLEAERTARAATEKMQASLSTTLRSIGDAVIATDAHGLITTMNPVAESLTGWSESEARGLPLTNVFRILNEQTRDVVANPADRVLEQGAVVGLANHTVLLSRDGRELPIDDSGAPIRDEEGRIEGVVLVFRDVSSTRREEARRSFLAHATATLAESLDYEATLREVARLAVPLWADWCAVDVLTEGETVPNRVAVAHVDPAKVKLAQDLALKYPPKPDAPRGVPQVLRTGRSELYPEIQEELLVGETVDAEHLSMARALGLRSAMVVPLAARGHILGAMTFVYAESNRAYSDVDLKLAEELAHRGAIAIDNARLFLAERESRKAADIANRSKDEFLAIVSHELRNPLAPIVTALEVMDLRGVVGAEQERTVLRRQVRHLTRLVDDLLDVSRVTTGKLQLSMSQVEVSEIIAGAIEIVSPLLEERRHRLHLDVPAKGLLVSMDVTRMTQVMANLLTNAAKYTDPEGELAIIASMEGGKVVIRISDSGVGIEPKMLSAIFEVFAQGAQAVDRARGGMGLGLPIARSIVTLHGGQLSATSAGRGKGSVFTVELPLSVSSVEEPSERKDSRHRPERADLRTVLIVDDNQDAAEMLSESLAARGYRTRVALNGPSALALLTEFTPDAALLDIGLPAMDGYELAQRIRATAVGAKMRLLAVTGYGQEADQRRAREAGFDAHLVKPLSVQALLDALSDAPAAQKPGSRARG